MSTGKVLLGVLAVVAAGALLGVLMAPNKGSDTRKKIVKKGNQYTDDLQEKFNDFLESVSEKFEQVKDDVTGFADKAKSKSEEVKHDMKSSKA